MGVGTLIAGNCRHTVARDEVPVGELVHRVVAVYCRRTREERVQEPVALLLLLQEPCHLLCRLRHVGPRLRLLSGVFARDDHRCLAAVANLDWTAAWLPGQGYQRKEPGRHHAENAASLRACGRSQRGNTADKRA